MTTNKPHCTIAYDFEQMDERYRLLANPLNAHAPFDGQMFETYGEELAFVMRQNLATVWTLIKEDGVLSLLSGFHVANRLGYLLTRHAVEDGILIVVPLRDESDPTFD